MELFSRHGFFMAVKFPEANVGSVLKNSPVLCMLFLAGHQ